MDGKGLKSKTIWTSMPQLLTYKLQTVDKYDPPGKNINYQEHKNICASQKSD